MYRQRGLYANFFLLIFCFIAWKKLGKPEIQNKTKRAHAKLCVVGHPIPPSWEVELGRPGLHIKTLFQNTNTKREGGGDRKREMYSSFSMQSSNIDDNG